MNNSVKFIIKYILLLLSNNICRKISISNMFKHMYMYLHARCFSQSHCRSYFCNKYNLPVCNPIHPYSMYRQLRIVQYASKHTKDAYVHTIGVHQNCYIWGVAFLPKGFCVSIQKDDKITARGSIKVLSIPVTACVDDKDEVDFLGNTFTGKLYMCYTESFPQLYNIKLQGI